MSRIALRHFVARNAILLCIGALLIAPAIADETPIPMATAGQFMVGASGAFTYSVPISVPPGTAGMLPSLGLGYSSQSGDGYEGQGWSLSGLPMITRCARTLAQDVDGTGKHIHGSVNFDANDRFCMAGMRFVPTGNTVPCPDHSAGTEYRTEVDGGSRIIACGVSGNGPAFFRIWTKSGQIMDFGNTADSKGQLVHAGGPTGPAGTVVAWAVNKIADTAGNYLKVVYDYGTPDTVNGELFPTEIDYTLNDAQGITTGYNTVRFEYNATRNDPQSYFQAGSVVTETRLLTAIKTYASGAMVSNYTLRYDYATDGTTHNELRAITQCDVNGACLHPVSFYWQGSRNILTKTKQTLGIAQGDGNNNRGFIFPGDFDGDGLIDFAAGNNIATGGCNVFLGQQAALLSFLASSMQAETWQASGDGGGGGCPTCVVNNGGGDPPPPWGQGKWVPGPACFSGVATKPKYLPRFTDFDGNGLSDVLVYEPNMGSTITALENNGKGTFVHTIASGLYDDSYTADFDGDGRTDVFAKPSSDGWFQIFQSQGNGAFQQVGTSYNKDNTFFLGDFDGDGCTDILQQNKNNEIDYSPLCNPAVSHVSVDNWLSPLMQPAQVVVGDFNGDGKSDILVAGISIWLWGQDYAGLFLSTGTGIKTVWTETGQGWPGGSHTIETGDFNGDGKTDLLLVADDMYGHADTTTPDQIWLSTGTGFVRAKDASGAYVTLDPGNGDDGPNNNIANLKAIVADWNNDGASDVWIEKQSGDAQYTFAYVPELINSVTNGLGVTTSVTYDRLNHNGAIYNKCPGGTCADTYPTSALDGALYVVSRVDSSNGIGGTYSSTYSYGGAKLDQWGRFFLGFQTTTVTDLQTHIVQTTNYRTDFPFIGTVASQTKVCPQPYCNASADVVLTSTVNTYQSNPACTSAAATGPIYTLYLCSTVVTGNDTDGTSQPSTETDYSRFDGFANPGTVTISTTPPGGSTPDLVRVTTSTFTNFVDDTHWCPSRLVTANVKSTWNGAYKVRHTAYDYDIYNGVASTCLINKEVVEPGYVNTNLWQETDTSYDGFGNKHIVTVYGCADNANPCTLATPRVTTRTYDSNGEFLITAVNPANQTDQFTYDPRFGGPKTHTDANNLQTSWTYDTYGRRLRQNNPDGTYVTGTYNYCTDSGISCPTNGSYVVSSQSLGTDGSQIGANAATYFDALGRNIGLDLQGFDGSMVRTDTLYDPLGRVAAKDRPYFKGAGNIVPCADSQTACMTFTYDILGRIVTTQNPDGGKMIAAYDGQTERDTNALNQITTTVKNDLGLVASVTDALAKGKPDPTYLHTIRYTYDMFGNMVGTTDPSGNTTSTNYDLRGRKTHSTDPDLGTWGYDYDSFSDMVLQVDNNENHNGTSTTQTFDVVGRLVNRVEPDMVSHWDYDGAPNGIGRLQDVTCSGTACSGGVAYTRTYQYDTKGRQQRVTVQIGANSYFSTITYDATSGRAAKVRDFSAFSLVYGYNAYGYLNEIDDAVNMGTAYWKANTRDAEMHITSQTAANGVTELQNYDPETGRVLAIHAGTNDSVANFSFDWDKMGNLTQRSDMLAVTGGQTENFCYDKLNRLTSTALGSNIGVNCTGTLAVAYDALGNITSKSDVGTYSYQPGRPHAVSAIATSQGCTQTGGCTVNGTLNPSFNYDRNGNMLTGAGRTITYTSFNMTSLVTVGTTSMALAYSPEHTRIQQTTNAGSGATTTTYLNDEAGTVMDEHVVPAIGPATWKTYIKASGQIFAVHSVKSGTASVRYFVDDHLGSIAVVTDENGLVAGREFYDAWGKMRNNDGSPDQSCSLPVTARNTAQTSRGYTGQEQMPEVCLVNYNARIYDPQIGRFLSGDPKLQDINNLQDFNRYTYVYNNPLSLTDPSGYCSGFFGCLFSVATFGLFDVFAQVFKSVPILGDLFIIASAAICGPLCGAEAAAAVTEAEGGNIGQIFQSFFVTLLTAEAFYEVGQYVDGLETAAPGMKAAVSNELGGAIRIGLHGFVGGLSSVASGGKFGSGFLAAGFGAIADDIPVGNSFGAGLAVHALAGGFGSELGGGKFGNGAITAAFGYLYNKLLEDDQASWKTKNLQQTLHDKYGMVDNSEYDGLYRAAEDTEYAKLAAQVIINELEPEVELPAELKAFEDGINAGLKGQELYDYLSKGDEFRDDVEEIYDGYLEDKMSYYEFWRGVASIVGCSYCTNFQSPFKVLQTSQ